MSMTLVPDVLEGQVSDLPKKTQFSEPANVSVNSNI